MDAVTTIIFRQNIRVKKTERKTFGFLLNIIGKLGFILGSNWGVKIFAKNACRTEGVSLTENTGFYIINRLYLLKNGTLARRIYGTPLGSNPGGASKK